MAEAGREPLSVLSTQCRRTCTSFCPTQWFSPLYWILPFKTLLRAIVKWIVSYIQWNLLGRYDHSADPYLIPHDIHIYPHTHTSVAHTGRHTQRFFNRKEFNGFHGNKCMYSHWTLRTITSPLSSSWMGSVDSSVVCTLLGFCINCYDKDSDEKWLSLSPVWTRLYY